MKHTAGPWHIAEDEHGNFGIFGGHSVNNHAVVYNVDYRQEESIANARLIKASPELLETLINLVELHDETPSMLTAEDWEKARAVIAKAKGEH